METTNQADKAPQLANVYFSTVRSMRFGFADGSVAHFIGGKYVTDSEKEIKELNTELKNRNPHLYTKVDQLTVDLSVTPEELFKAKIIAEFLANQRALDTAAVNNTTESKSVSSGLNAVNSNGADSTAQSGMLTPVANASAVKLSVSNLVNK